MQLLNEDAHHSAPGIFSRVGAEVPDVLSNKKGWRAACVASRAARRCAGSFARRRAHVFARGGEC